MTYVLEAPVLKPVGLPQVGPSPSMHSGCRWRGMPVLVRERERLACCLRRYRLFHQSFTPVHLAVNNQSITINVVATRPILYLFAVPSKGGSI